MTEIVNRGTGAGGANTNANGKRFETETNNEPRLIADGFKKTFLSFTSKYGYYLTGQYDEYSVVFMSQTGLKAYIKAEFGIDLWRCPDEAYLIKFNNPDERPILKILEKKEQSVEGSVETKLMTGAAFRREYEVALGDRVIVHYAYCVNQFLKNKIESGERKYNTLKQILAEDKVPMFYGEDADYFEKLDEWIHSV
jgi:hypothetical protein